MAGRASRAKGVRGELEAARYLSPLFPDCRRRACGEESQSAQGRDLSGCYPLAVQVKVMAHPNPLSALREACAAASDSEIPCAYVRQVTRNVPAGNEPAVILRARDFRRLIVAWQMAQTTYPKRYADRVIEVEAADD